MQGGFDQIAVRRALVEGVPPMSTVILAVGRPFAGLPNPGEVFGSGIVCLPSRATSSIQSANKAGEVIFDNVPTPHPSLPIWPIFAGLSLPFQALYQSPTPDTCGEVWNATNAVLLLLQTIQ